MSSTTACSTTSVISARSSVPTTTSPTCDVRPARGVRRSHPRRAQQARARHGVRPRQRGPRRRRTWKPKIFHNFEGPDSDGAQLAYKVGTYTSAAPTYFDTADGYIDGGVFASNPSDVRGSRRARTRAICLADRAELSQVRLFSFGTGRFPDLSRRAVARLGLRAVDPPARQHHARRGQRDRRLPVSPDPRRRPLLPPRADFPTDKSIDQDDVGRDPLHGRVRRTARHHRRGRLAASELVAGSVIPLASTDPGRVPSNRRVRARAPRPRPDRARARCGSRAGRTSPARRHTPRARAPRRSRGPAAAAATRRDPGVSPSASSTSDGSSRGCAPSAISALVPAAAGLRREPGIASTGRPYSSARSAVMRAPPRTRGLHHDDDVGERGDDPVPDRERARRGAARRSPSSLTSSPDSRTPLNSAAWRRGYTTSSPVATTPIASPPAVERAPVRGGVDADREPAHDRDTRFAQRRAHLVRVGEPVRRCRTRADDRDAWSFERGRAVAFGEQHLGPAGHVVGDRVVRRGRRRTRGCRVGTRVSSTRSVAGDLLPEPRERDPRRDVLGVPRAGTAHRSRGRAGPPRARRSGRRQRSEERTHAGGSHVGEAREDRGRRARPDRGVCGGGRAWSRRVAPQQRRALEVRGGDLGRVVEVGERARDASDPCGASAGEHAPLDQIAPRVVGVGTERRAGGRRRPAGTYAFCAHGQSA